MKILTEEHLSDVLSQESSWRKKELANLRSLLEAKRDYFEKEKVLGRCGVAILYAHWEGFVKHAASAYLEFVAMQRMRHCELPDNFLSIILKNKFGVINASSSFVQFNMIAKFFDCEFQNQSNLPHKHIINTQSNLSSGILKEIINLLGLDPACYESKKNLLDKKLLEKRNQIAHGDYVIIDIDEYVELHEEIISLIELLKTQIENAVAQRKYKRIPGTRA